MLPKISICVPLYNGERYLAETLDSVVIQQGVDLEIIIGDDGSTDRSLEIARDYAQRYPHLKWSILSSGERLGMAGNWNACIRAANGDFVKVIGQDDLIYPAASASQAELLEKNPSVSLVVSGCDIISGVGRKIFTRPRKRGAGIYRGSEVATDCLRQRANLIGEPVTVMARRQDLLRLGGFSAEHRYYIDLELWLRLLGIGDCALIAEPQSAFRIHGKAVSSFSQKSDFEQFDELPGAKEVLENLTATQRQIRETKARLSTIVRSLIYRIFG
jgi:glycosyltransferase involved in cell wall biosynthesis